MYLPYKLQEKIIEFFIKMAALLLQKQSIFPFTVLNDVFLLCRAQVKEQLWLNANGIGQKMNYFQSLAANYQINWYQDDLLCLFFHLFLRRFM